MDDPVHSLAAKACCCLLSAVCRRCLQGSAADLAKAAMISIHTRLAAAATSASALGGGGGRGGVTEAAAQGGARLVLQIHDEFLLEVPGGSAGVCAPAWMGFRGASVSRYF